jgi:hypothetical protein
MVAGMETSRTSFPTVTGSTAEIRVVPLDSKIEVSGPVSVTVTSSWSLVSPVVMVATSVRTSAVKGSWFWSRSITRSRISSPSR